MQGFIVSLFVAAAILFAVWRLWQRLATHDTDSKNTCDNCPLSDKCNEKT